MYFNPQGGAILEGTAQPENVLEGKTFYNTEADKIQTGTMPYQGTAVQALKRGQNSYGVYYYIPKGYYEERGSRA